MHFAQDYDVIDLTSDNDGDEATLSKTSPRVAIHVPLQLQAPNDRARDAAIQPQLLTLPPQSSDDNLASTSAHNHIRTDSERRDPLTKKRQRASTSPSCTTFSNCIIYFVLNTCLR